MEFQKEWIEISLNGTNQFELILHSPVSRVVINGASFQLERRTRRAAFEEDENGWR